MGFISSTACRVVRRLAPLLVTVMLAAPGHAAVAPASPSDAQRLVFLLEYIGTDYAGAVRDGQVVSQVEYGEMLRLTKQLIEGYGGRPARSEVVTTGLAELQTLIRQRAAAEQVRTTSRLLLPQLVRALGLSIRPPTVPNLANGRRLWSSDCAPCHGPTGAGDGPAAADMEPPPTAFAGDRLAQLSPRQVFHALTFGIDGTAMPSFTAYTEEERWDVAFFLMTLRADFEPKRPLQDPGLSLDELAASSNVELLSRLRQRWPDISLAEVDWLRTHFASASGAAPALAGADGASGGLAVALQLQEVFGRIADGVLPRVVGVTGYVRDPAWSLEKLQAERGEAWMLANADALRYPGFRPVRSGSGFLLDDGYVISCNHLVRDDHDEVVQMVDIELPNQTHVAGGVVGSEPTLDLAILRTVGLPGSDDLPELTFADSDQLQVGQWVIALGDPPGPQKVFAVGVVSAPPERQCYQEQRSATLLQSSLVVFAGGLGGPVVDIFGHCRRYQHRPGKSRRPCAGERHGAGRSHAADQPRPEPVRGAQGGAEPALAVAGHLGARAAAHSPTARSSGAGKGLPAHRRVHRRCVHPEPRLPGRGAAGDFLVGLGGHPLLSVADFQMWLYVLGIGTQAELDLMRDGQPLQAVAPIEVRPQSATMR
jgi:S1-C subfamily serine protease